MEQKIPAKRALQILCAIALLLSLSACGTRTIYLASGEPVRLRKPVKGAAVWVLDSKGVPTAGEIDLPEGWYCLPDPGAKK